MAANGRPALDVVFADSCVIVLNKPPNVLSVPSGSTNFNVKELWVAAVVSAAKDATHLELLKRRGKSVRIIDCAGKPEQWH